ncbi:DUF4198 domain-containing protein [Desulfosarcina sp. OttesenSCG-928-B08]|nr:DUF4198 domain-containing protein [Desulfosarcina sp. OttesenSCG-928-B08]
MKSSHLKFLTMACFGALMVLKCPPAMAHGLGWQQDFQPTVTLQFVFSDGEPLAYGEVSIFSPAESRFEYQKGRSDQNGFFTFRPNQAGVWTFSGGDGQGHKTIGEIHVTDPAPAAATDTGAAPVSVPEKGGAAGRMNGVSILLGLSIIFNLTLLGLWRKSATSRGEEKP